MRIYLITGHQYPIGTAQTNRLRSYLEALASLGHDVNVLIYRPSEVKEDVKNKMSGRLNNVNYLSSAYSIGKMKNPLLARITWIYGYLNCLRLLFKENKQSSIDIIIQGSSKSSIIPLVYMISRIIKCRYILENSEYPWFILKKRSIRNTLDKILYLHLYYKLFDGVLAMTKTLQLYHKKYSKKNAQIFHLPMTVDINRFNIKCASENYITYVGNLSYYKDGVDVLVESFIHIAAKYPRWKLRIIGNTSCDHLVKQRATEVSLEDRIILMGMVDRDDVPALLCSSKILALARPSSLQSDGGFPTKLGEYLATGNLVVVTAVGEIPNYLENEVSALIADPDSIESFASKLDIGITKNKEFSSVMVKGREVCTRVFNSKVQAVRLSNYFKRL